MVGDEFKPVVTASSKPKDNVVVIGQRKDQHKRNKRCKAIVIVFPNRIRV